MEMPSTVFEWVLVSLLVVCLIALAVLLLWAILYTIISKVRSYDMPYTRLATVKTLSYMAETSRTRERYMVVFSIDDDTVFPWESADMFDELEPGDRVELTLRERKILGEEQTKITDWRKI